jgi:5'-nucleotidase
MRILVTNDDGIHAEGLAVLEAIAAQLSDDVWVVAPETDQSGVAHSLSLSNPLRLRQIDTRRYAVAGTPTDCVIMAARSIMIEQRPDLVLSGVNRGQNVAEDVTYSGTIAAAMEGTLLGIPSIAVSQAYGPAGRDQIHWDCAKHHAPGIIRRLLDEGIPRDVLFNLNFPNVPPSEVKPVSR